MKKIIPMQKEISFRTMIGEMTEISLEHSLKLMEQNTIEGNLVVFGTYKMTEASTIEEEFKEVFPVTIELDSKYDTSHITIDIEDFYYEIINDNILRVSVEIAVDNLEEQENLDLLEQQVETDLSLDETVIQKQLEKNNDFVGVRSDMKEENLLQSYDNIPEVLAEEIPVETPSPTVSVVKEKTKEKNEEKEIKPLFSDTSGVGSIFSALENTEETFSTYYVYIVRDGDTVDGILEKYKITREELGNYNHLDDVKIGSKLIIPCTIHEAHS